MRDQKVYLNGVDLEAVHPAVMLQHIQDNGASLSPKTADLAASPGQWLTANRPQKREIVIEFAIRERLDFTVRADVVTAVTAWAAGGGWLELSDRPGLRLYVQPSELPSLGKLREWTNSISVGFTAYTWPFWIEAAPPVTKATGVTEETMTVTAAGTWETRLEAEITPTGGTLTSAEISAGDETMTLTSLSVAQDTALRIRWDERHLLRIEAGGSGLLSHRAGGDLVLMPGAHDVDLTLSTACDVKLWARGCYL